MEKEKETYTMVVGRHCRGCKQKTMHKHGTVGDSFIVRCEECDETLLIDKGRHDTWEEVFS